MKSTREILGFVIAPLFSPIVFCVFYLQDNIELQHNGFDIVVLFIQAWAFFSIFFLPFAYLLTLLFAIPAYWLLKKYRQLSLLSLSFSAVVIANIPLIPSYLDTTQQPESPYLTISSINGGALLVAFVFWLFVRKQIKNKTEHTAQKAK